MQIMHFIYLSWLAMAVEIIDINSMQTLDF